MTPEIAVLIVGLVFAVLVVCETPIAMALAASGGLGILLLRDAPQVTAAFADVSYGSVASYGLVVIPMYVLLGIFALRGHLADRVYRIGSRVFGRFRGGLGIATVGACAGFAAVTGSSVATAATIGRVSVHEMRAQGYRAPFATGIVASAATLGILIPPSTILVIYGITARESIQRLLMAGIVPGVISAVVLAVFIAWRARQNVDDVRASLEKELELVGAAPAPQATVPVGSSRGSGALPGGDTAVPGGDASTEDWPVQLRAVIWITLIFLCVMGGIYGGFFTVTESGAIGALLALVMLVCENLRMGARGIAGQIGRALVESASVTSMMFAIVIGASVLSLFLVMTRIPIRLSDWVAGLPLPNTLMLIVICAIVILLGMVLESMSIVLITVPLLYPLVTGLGYDGVWFGILLVKLIEIGLLTPPVGLNVYVISGASGVSVEKAFRGVMPFVLVDLCLVALFIALPGIVLWLPNTLID